jgi:hypothetical protein
MNTNGATIPSNQIEIASALSTQELAQLVTTPVIPRESASGFNWVSSVNLSRDNVIQDIIHIVWSKDATRNINEANITWNVVSFFPAT